MSTGQLCLVFVPILVTLFKEAENQKSSPLSEIEVLEIRDSATCIAVPVSTAFAMLAMSVEVLLSHSPPGVLIERGT